MVHVKAMGPVSVHLVLQVLIVRLKTYAAIKTAVKMVHVMLIPVIANVKNVGLVPTVNISTSVAITTVTESVLAIVLIINAIAQNHTLALIVKLKTSVMSIPVKMMVIA